MNTTKSAVKAAVTTSERCDRCGAAARVIARNPNSKLELFMCDHHGRQHGPKLHDQGFSLLAADNTVSA